MLAKIFDKILYTHEYGTFFADAKIFDGCNFYTKENILNYRLSKIKFFVKNKDSKEIILGLQTTYIDNEGKEICIEESRDKTEKEFEIRTLEIPLNDYICHFFVKLDFNCVLSQIKLITNKGREIIVGNEEGEERFVHLNNNKDYMVLGFSGGYRKCLEAFGVFYIKFEDYFGNIRGFFELRKKLKDIYFKADINSKFDQLNKIDKALYKVCCLEDELFYSIIKYDIY